MYRGSFVFLLAVIGFTATSVRAEEFLDEDLGFNSGVGGSRFGEICSKALSHRDVDSHFIINNLPVSYRRPTTNENLEAFKLKLEDALKTARAKASGDSRGLALLLESGVCFYQKQNLYPKAYDLMKELTELKQRSSADAPDLVASKIALAKIARTLYLYDEAERALAEALIVQRGIESASPVNGEIYAELYWLYMDMGKGLKAALSRKECIRIGGRDSVLADQAWMFGTEFNSWPPIINALDAAATAQDLEAALTQADKQASNQLKEALAQEKAEKEKQEKERQANAAEKEQQAKQDRARVDEDNRQKEQEALAVAEKQRREKIRRESAVGEAAGGGQ